MSVHASKPWPGYEGSGYGNWLHGITVLLTFAMLTKCVFLLRMNRPLDINYQMPFSGIIPFQ